MDANLKNAAAALLLVPLLLAASACGGYLQRAAVADRVASEQTLNLRHAADDAHRMDCNLTRDGLQPCLSDEAYQQLRAGFNRVARAGLAFGEAIRTSDQATAKKQALVVVHLIDQLLQDDTVVHLRPEDKLVATTALMAVRTAFAALL
jgi:hypothetical protein